MSTHRPPPLATPRPSGIAEPTASTVRRSGSAARPCRERRRGPWWLVALIAGLLATAGEAQGLHLDVDDREPVANWIAVPFVFSTETLDVAYGLAGGGSQNFQESSRFFAAVMNTANDSRAIFLTLSQLRLTERWYLDAFVSAGRYTDMRAYVDEPGSVTEPRPGSNESSPTAGIRGAGTDSWFDVRVRHVLPIGDGRDRPLARWVLDDGLIVDGQSGARSWSPADSGRTVFELRPMLRSWRSESEAGLSVFDQAMLAASLEWDNTDYPQNPSRGTFQRVTLKQGLAIGDRTNEFTVIEAEVAGYLPLGAGAGLRQVVLALDAWTADAVSADEDGSGRPPPYEGARLGGFHRLRGYPAHRFHDSAALYGCAELRVIPDWNPLRGGILQPLQIDWLQFVGFAEAGRVAPSWSLSTFFDDPKWSAGIGTRLMARRTVVRLDAAWSDESWALWAMVGHPFGSR
jgi:hypothetical protein